MSKGQKLNTRPIKASHISKIKARPRYQRSFFSWLAQNHEKFLVELQIEERTDKGIRFSFIGCDPAIVGHLFKDALYIFINGADPVDGCLIAADCDWQSRASFPDRETHWTHNLYETLLYWVNHELATC